jgi:hypothetical protein
MKTLDETIELMESLNGTAYDMAYDSWLDADFAEDNDDDNAERLRELASEEQQEYFREEFADLSDDDKEAIRQWYKNDEDFREQFQTYYGGELYE